MYKINCEIIEDILPLYVENMASKSTVEMVDAHLCECEQCKKKMQMLRKDVMIPMETETDTIKGIQRKIKKNNAVAAVVSGFLVFILVILVVIHLGSPILIDSYEDAVRVETDAEGNVTLVLSEKVAGYSLTEMSGEEVSKGVYFLSCWDTKWNQLFTVEQERRIAVGDVNMLYYYSPQTLDEQQDTLLYSAEDNEMDGSGVITLPRLVLRYYLFLAGILCVIGIFISIFIRKRDKRYISQKITLFFAAYVVSSVLVLIGKKDIYNVGYYLSCILVLSIVLYVLFYYVLRYTIWKKQSECSIAGEKR